MKKITTATKKTRTNNVIVTYRTKDGVEFCGRYKTIENAMKYINGNKWNSPKNLGFEVLRIEDKSAE